MARRNYRFAGPSALIEFHLRLMASFSGKPAAMHHSYHNLYPEYLSSIKWQTILSFYLFKYNELLMKSTIYHLIDDIAII